VVAERLDYPRETALTLGRFVAGSSARAKARGLGIMDEAQDAAAAGLKPRVETVRLLGRDIPVLAAPDGTRRRWRQAGIGQERAILHRGHAGAGLHPRAVRGNGPALFRHGLLAR